MKEVKDTRNRLLRQLLILLGFIVLLNIFNKFYSHLFSESIFPALQVFRCITLSTFNWSFGDVAYSVGVLYLLYKSYLLIRHKKWQHKAQLLIALLQITRLVLVVSIVLYLLWSALYAQPKLTEKLNLPSANSISNEELFRFDSILIQRMNHLMPQLDSLNFVKVNSIAAHEYQDLNLPFALKAKPSLFGEALAYFGVSGFFNPFTGEAQIDPTTPYFMMPFLVCHEMAHQTGIAAEDDANLMAYMQCVESENTSFRYAGYFNIWLYAHHKVFKLDSTKATILKASLNSVSLNHLEILKRRNEQYHNFLDDWSTYIFDAFLKMGNQQDGISSYRNVAYSALLWEQKRIQAKEANH